uniref:Uncharacterized protein n=1 Tax=Sipha flava TaxID=143950 RepID=A0A2S2Q030_9HEMI
MGDSFKRTSGSGRKIDTFFTKKLKFGSENRQNDSSISTSISNFDQGNSLAIDIPCTLSAFESEQRKDFLVHLDYSSDIGCFIGKKNIDNFTKANLLEKHWIPPINYEFPFCVVTKNGKKTKMYAQKSHLDKFHWLVLSHKDQGLYCKYCALFGTGSGDGVQTNTPLKRLVKQPLKAFDDLLREKGSLLIHQRNKYHQMSVEAGKNFLVNYHIPDLNVANQVCKQ